MSISRRLMIGGAVAAAAAMAAPAAVAMTVQPVVLDLQTSGRGMSQIVTVENTFANPLTVEIKIDELRFDETGAHPTGADSGELLVFPPQAIIQPGQTQAFRVQWVGDPELATSKHFYVTVAQLPVQLPEGQSAIQILYNFQVLVSVQPNGAKPALTVVSTTVGDDGQGHPIPVVTMTNTANGYGYLSQGRLRIVQRDASGKEVFQRSLSGPEIQQTIGFGLIAPGQRRRVSIPIQLPTREGSVEATFTPETRR